MFFRTLARRSTLKTDVSLINLPDAVASSCQVFRNVVTEAEQQLLWDELSPLIAKDGEKSFVRGKLDDKELRNAVLDLFGYEKFAEMKDYSKMTTKRVPGIPFSPTLYSVCHGVAKQLLGFVADTARIIEHHQPGYEMHIATPTQGSQFLYLSLLSPTVVNFDNEATQQIGQVLLPPRSALLVFGELRWGWRFGQRFDPVQTFRSSTGTYKKITPDYRLSIQLCKFVPGMVDRKRLTDMAKHSIDSALTTNALAENDKASAQSIQKPDIFAEKMEIESFGRGALGGDLVSKKLPTESERANQYQQYKSDISRFSSIIEKMDAAQKRGEVVSDSWLKDQFKMSDNQGPDEFGFDPNDPMGTAQAVDDKCRHFKEKIEAMEYNDGVSVMAARKKTKSEGSFGQHFEMIQQYAKSLGISKEMDKQKIEATLERLPDLKGKIPDFPGMDLEIDLPVTSTKSGL